MKKTLVSFNLCPYVQRSVIVMREKKAVIDIEYIDLANPPSWFNVISPLGRVPLLKVDREVLFESAVICEYLDETTPPSLHPSDPLQRALNRSWIEFASDLIASQYRFFTASTQADFDTYLEKIKESIQRLETKLGTGPFFNGGRFCIVDASFAPFFTRSVLLEPALQMKGFQSTPKVARWADALVNRPSVTSSVVPDFADTFIGYVKSAETYTANFFR